jgi:hypothetical protein
VKSIIETWFGKGGIRPWITKALDFVAGCIMLLIFYGGICYALDSMRVIWSGIWVPAVLFSPFWLGVRAVDLWKENEKLKQERREAEERYKRLLLEQSGKN